ncbi:hypothetical protein [Cellulomonas denverensis]|uniref:Uncharacterized protein n=2 Tax=Cellulomonas denverensis TaxID=264297 RepID=A0A7X6KUJ2_9CELL|nr:hypothetical protein [Cellulomonas denverensis]NKY22249.1 hypothetical protein [Cellulomonas denverensis]GIG26913.1 hypothetical protein Cde04nite_31570 [Cellulomonas denverensis]
MPGPHDARPSAHPTSLIAVTNEMSAALIPSDLYVEGFEEAALEAGNHLYLIAVGPRIEPVSVIPPHDGWKLRTRFYDRGYRPRTVPVPQVLFPDGDLRVTDSVLFHVTAQSDQPLSAIDVTRRVLAHAAACDSEHLRSWQQYTIRKFFTYRVVYIGQAFGRKKRRSAVKRLADGHEKLQRVLSEINDLYRTSDVGVIVTDARVHGRELNLTLGPGNADEFAQATVDFMTMSFGPLENEGLTIDAAEAMLIRYFQPRLNDKLREFPLKDRPGLVQPLLGAGITHLGVHLDVAQSRALLADPVTNEARSRHRFAINLATGERETPASNAPTAWRM